MSSARFVSVVAVVFVFLLSSGGCARQPQAKYSVTFDVQEPPPAPPAPPPSPPTPPLLRLDLVAEGPFQAGEPVAVRVTGRPGLEVAARAHRGADPSTLEEEPGAPGTYRGELGTSKLAPGRYRPVAETGDAASLFRIESPREILLVASLLEQHLREINGTLRAVYFETSRWDLSPDALRDVAFNAELLQKTTDFAATVEGHGDARGTDEHNLWLGMWRAKVVKEALVSAGLDPKHLRIVSHGNSRPAAEGSDERSLALNRRVEIVVRDLR